MQRRRRSVSTELHPFSPLFTGLRLLSERLMTRLVRQNGEKEKQKKKKKKKGKRNIEQSNFARDFVTTEIVNRSYFGHMGVGLSNLGFEKMAPII